MAHTNEKIHVGQVVDDNGVILQDIYEGDKIVAANQTEYKNTHITNFKKGDSFIKVFTNPIIELFKELSTKEYAVAMALLPFISYTDGILRYNNKMVDGKEICDILEENYETFKRIISSLVSHRVLARINRPSDTYNNRTKKGLVVNPYIFLRGQDIEKDIVQLFVDSKWANLS